jgi:hypothetical protein
VNKRTIPQSTVDSWAAYATNEYLERYASQGVALRLKSEELSPDYAAFVEGALFELKRRSECENTDEVRILDAEQTAVDPEEATRTYHSKASRR